MFHCVHCYGSGFAEDGIYRKLEEWLADVENVKKEILIKLEKRRKFNQTINDTDDLGLQLQKYTRTYAKIFQKFHSVFSHPLLAIDIENIVCPPLHIICGILNKIKEKAEEKEEDQAK